MATFDDDLLSEEDLDNIDNIILFYNIIDNIYYFRVYNLPKTVEPLSLQNALYSNHYMTTKLKLKLKLQLKLQ